MRHDTITVDYFLRDNRTWAPGIGKDWGIKAATGALAPRLDLRTAFDRYCRALPSDHGYLSGFKQAVGGLRSTDGYLLCVTLETSDPFGRPSWAVYGLWCPGNLIGEVAACDPATIVQALLPASDPPPSITLQPCGAVSHSPVPTDDRALRRFDRQSTHAEVFSMLLDAVHRNAPLPNILGITASSRLSTLIEQFDVVYCHPLDDDAGRAFEYLGPRAFRAAPPETSVAGEGHGTQSFSWGTVAALACVGVVSLLGRQWLVLPRISSAAPPAALRDSRPKTGTLREIALRTKTIEALDPDALLRTRGYTILSNDGAVEKRIADRQKLRGAYASLIDLRERIARRPDSDVATLQKIYSLPRGRQPPGEACKTIRDAFGFEFDAPDSTLRSWCESLVDLETLTASRHVDRGTSGRMGRTPS